MKRQEEQQRNKIVLSWMNNGSISPGPGKKQKHDGSRSSATNFSTTTRDSESKRARAATARVKNEIDDQVEHDSFPYKSALQSTFHFVKNSDQNYKSVGNGMNARQETQQEREEDEALNFPPSANADSRPLTRVESGNSLCSLFSLDDATQEAREKKSQDVVKRATLSTLKPISSTPEDEDVSSRRTSRCASAARNSTPLHGLIDKPIQAQDARKNKEDEMKKRLGEPHQQQQQLKEELYDAEDLASPLAFGGKWTSYSRQVSNSVSFTGPATPLVELKARVRATMVNSEVNSKHQGRCIAPQDSGGDEDSEDDKTPRHASNNHSSIASASPIFFSDDGSFYKLTFVPTSKMPKARHSSHTTRYNGSENEESAEREGRDEEKEDENVMEDPFGLDVCYDMHNGHYYLNATSAPTPMEGIEENAEETHTGRDAHRSGKPPSGSYAESQREIGQAVSRRSGLAILLARPALSGNKQVILPRFAPCTLTQARMQQRQQQQQQQRYIAAYGNMRRNEHRSSAALSESVLLADTTQSATVSLRNAIRVGPPTAEDDYHVSSRVEEKEEFDGTDVERVQSLNTRYNPSTVSLMPSSVMNPFDLMAPKGKTRERLNTNIEDSNDDDDAKDRSGASSYLDPRTPPLVADDGGGVCEGNDRFDKSNFCRTRTESQREEDEEEEAVREAAEKGQSQGDGSPMMASRHTHSYASSSNSRSYSDNNKDDAQQLYPSAFQQRRQKRLSDGHHPHNNSGNNNNDSRSAQNDGNGKRGSVKHENMRSMHPLSPGHDHFEEASFLVYTPDTPIAAPMTHTIAQRTHAADVASPLTSTTPSSTSTAKSSPFCGANRRVLEGKEANMRRKAKQKRAFTTDVQGEGDYYFTNNFHEHTDEVDEEVLKRCNNRPTDGEEESAVVFNQGVGEEEEDRQNNSNDNNNIRSRNQCVPTDDVQPQNFEQQQQQQRRKHIGVAQVHPLSFSMLETSATAPRDINALSQETTLSTSNRSADSVTDLNLYHGFNTLYVVQQDYEQAFLELESNPSKQWYAYVIHDIDWVPTPDLSPDERPLNDPLAALTEAQQHHDEECGMKSMEMAYQPETVFTTADLTNLLPTASSCPDMYDRDSPVAQPQASYWLSGDLRDPPRAMAPTPRVMVSANTVAASPFLSSFQPGVAAHARSDQLRQAQQQRIAAYGAERRRTYSEQLNTRPYN